MIFYAAHINAVRSALFFVKTVETQGANRAAIAPYVSQVLAGLSDAYEVFKKAFDESEAGKSPEDFTASITSPGPPPVPPANTEESVIWFQHVWGNMQLVLNRAGQKCPKIATLMESLGPSGEKLVGELKEIFGEPAEGSGVRYRSAATFSAVSFPEKFEDF